jgi:hypothetical protein
VFRLDFANTPKESGVYPVMEFFWLCPGGLVDLKWGHENIPRAFVMSFDAPNEGFNPDEPLLISDPRPIKVILEDIRRGKYTVPESVEAAQVALDGFSPGECHINPAAPIAIVCDDDGAIDIEPLSTPPAPPPGPTSVLYPSLFHLLFS